MCEKLNRCCVFVREENSFSTWSSDQDQDLLEELTAADLKALAEVGGSRSRLRKTSLKFMKWSYRLVRLYQWMTKINRERPKVLIYAISKSELASRPPRTTCWRLLHCYDIFTTPASSLIRLVYANPRENGQVLTWEAINVTGLSHLICFHLLILLKVTTSPTKTTG